MSYLLSGKVQTCYFNNVFCKIKIFEYLETGRYEDYRPRPGLKIFVKSPKIEIFGEWITFCEIMKKQIISKNIFFRWIDHFSDLVSIYRKIAIFGELIIL